jgi:hypothetical protein
VDWGGGGGGERNNHKGGTGTEWGDGIGPGLKMRRRGEVRHVGTWR